MQDNLWCNCIALDDFAIEDIKWKEWFNFTLSIFHKYGLKPTRLSVDGKPYGYSTKSLTFNAELRKLEKHQFANIESLSFMVIVDKDDSSNNFVIDTNLYPATTNSKMSFMTLCMAEQLELFNTLYFQELGKNFYYFTQAKYGYYYRRNLKCYPSVYPIGGNILFHGKNDEMLCDQWKKSIATTT